MSDVNRVIISGRLTRDAEVKNLPSGTSVVEFGLASNRKFKDKEDTTFIDCTMFGDRASNLAQYLTKGKKLIVEGRLRYESWEKDGQKRSRVGVVVDEVSFMEPPQKSEVESVSEERSAPDMSYVDLTENVPF
jgi:single-strand DNA-binding protein